MVPKKNIFKALTFAFCHSASSVGSLIVSVKTNSSIRVKRRFWQIQKIIDGKACKRDWFGFTRYGLYLEHGVWLIVKLENLGILCFWIHPEKTSYLKGCIRWPPVTLPFCWEILSLGNPQMIRQSSSERDAVCEKNQRLELIGKYIQRFGNIFKKEMVSCHWQSSYELWDYLRSAWDAILESLSVCFKQICSVWILHSLVSKLPEIPAVCFV